VPILNTNDAVAPPPEKNLDIQGVISIKDNDSLAARLAALIESDLLLIMSDVDGLFNKPPNEVDSRLLHTFSPKFQISAVNFGDSKSKVGTGGMAAKVQAANWALENNCSVVICNGGRENAILDTINGKRIGTFFANVVDENKDAVPIETQTLKGFYFVLLFKFQRLSEVMLDFIKCFYFKNSKRRWPKLAIINIRTEKCYNRRLCQANAQ
jgi:delta-1-pyrroline-5-carboxylate synthetase